MLSSAASYYAMDTSENDTLNKVFTPIEDPDPEQLEYPFSYIPMYDLRRFCGTVLGEPEELDPGNFPHNIAEYYWIQEGMNDEEEWRCLCKLENGYYVYYTASCDYTGFDCDGGMDMYIASTREGIFQGALTEDDRRTIVRDKTE